MESTNSHKEEENIGDTDMINSLPDPILSHILSFLPTKTCVLTSLVCRRWRHLWEQVQVIDICEDDDEFYGDLDSFERFSVFVNAVLSLRKCRNIKKLCLACCHSSEDTFYANSVAILIRAAIGNHLEELRLTLYSLDENGFVVPRTLFTCKNLVSLYLCGGIHVQNLSMVHLPSLKVLLIDIESMDSIETFLHGCPVLETLDLSFSAKNFTKLRVPPSLKRLNFVVDNNFGTDLEINTPFLNSLSITQRLASFSCSIGDLHKVEEVHLDVCFMDNFVNTLFKMFKALSRAHNLVLGYSTIKGLLRCPTLDIPEFHYLHQLKLTLPCFKKSFVMTILQKCHMLQFLIIENKNELDNFQSWGHATCAPNCHVLHLTFFHFKGYQGSDDELAFVAYVLQQGIVLETVVISTDDFLDINKKYQIQLKLFALSRSSRRCEIIFD